MASYRYQIIALRSEIEEMKRRQKVYENLVIEVCCRATALEKKRREIE